MRTYYRLVLTLILSFLCFLSHAAEPLSNPAGIWQTPRSTLKIYSVNGELRADVVNIRKKNVPQSPLCIKCSGTLKNQPIIGMTVLWGLERQSNNQWGGGKVVDPESGETYNASLQLSKDGKTINFHASKLIFGKMIVWKRIH